MGPMSEYSYKLVRAFLVSGRSRCCALIRSRFCWLIIDRLWSNTIKYLVSVLEDLMYTSCLEVINHLIDFDSIDKQSADGWKWRWEKWWRWRHRAETGNRSPDWCDCHMLVFLSLWGLLPVFSDLKQHHKIQKTMETAYLIKLVWTKVVNSHPHISCKMCILVLTMQQAQEHTHIHIP